MAKIGKNPRGMQRRQPAPIGGYLGRNFQPSGYLGLRPRQYDSSSETVLDDVEHLVEKNGKVKMGKANNKEDLGGGKVRLV